MSLSRTVHTTATLALVAAMPACSEGPPPPMDAESPPQNPDVIPIGGDSSNPPESPTPPPNPDNPDIIPIAGDSSNPPGPASNAELGAAMSSITYLRSAGLSILAAHNAERASVGAPPLKWNTMLAMHAADYARQLAENGRLMHASREGRGIERENLSEGNLGWTTAQMVNSWLGEKRLFHPGIFPNVCTGDWSRCAHYSQMIWPTTTDIGCGEASGHGHKWLVCRYSPGGNRDRKAVGMRFQER